MPRKVSTLGLLGVFWRVLRRIGLHRFTRLVHSSVASPTIQSCCCCFNFLSLFISFEIYCFHSQWTRKYLHNRTKSLSWLLYWFSIKCTQRVQYGNVRFIVENLNHFYSNKCLCNFYTMDFQFFPNFHIIWPIHNSIGWLFVFLCCSNARCFLSRTSTINSRLIMSFVIYKLMPNPKCWLCNFKQ